MSSFFNHSKQNIAHLFTSTRFAPRTPFHRHNTIPHARSSTPAKDNNVTSIVTSITDAPKLQNTTILPAAILTSILTAVEPSLAFQIHTEPSNALSLPTWMVHTSSVMEWSIAMGLMWKYADAIANPLWKGMAWGMLPCLGSAFCAVIYHFFYNSHDLDVCCLCFALCVCV